jgi:hypothetical protein
MALADRDGFVLTDRDSNGVDSSLGRPGMNLWEMLVLGTLRLNLNCDHDRLQEVANNHKSIRQIH